MPIRSLTQLRYESSLITGPKSSIELMMWQVKAGVKCALGTDLGISSEVSEYHHGMNGLELGYAVEAGMTPLQAIEAATANAPLTLGPQAPRSGILEAGYDADFIAVSKNPLEKIEILADPQSITHVWKGGRLFKAPGKPITFF